MSLMTAITLYQNFSDDATLPKTNSSSLKMVVSKFGISFSRGLFSGIEGVAKNRGGVPQNGWFINGKPY